MAEYKLSYTAAQIDEKLGKVTKNSEDIGALKDNVQVISDNVQVVSDNVQVKAEIVTLSTEEYETLEANAATNANTLYMLTDSADEEYALQIDLDTYQEKVNDSLALKADKTEIPTVPTDVSAFTNDVGYLTEHQSLADYVKTADLEAIYETKDNVSLLADEVAYINIEDNENITDVVGNIVYSVNGNAPDLAGNVTINIPNELADLSSDSTHRTVTDDEKNNWNAKSNFSGSYNDLQHKPVIPSIDGLATESYVNQKISAIPTSDVSGQISTHNTATDAHNDIRLLVEGLTTRLNTLADSDDTTLDQMSEIVAYIKSNKSLIDGITTNKVSVSDIIDNLTTNVSNKPLSAAQGVALKALIDAIPDWAKAATKPTYTASEVGALSVNGGKTEYLELPDMSALTFYDWYSNSIEIPRGTGFENKNKFPVLGLNPESPGVGWCNSHDLVDRCLPWRLAETQTVYNEETDDLYSEVPINPNDVAFTGFYTVMAGSETDPPFSVLESSRYKLIVSSEDTYRYTHQIAISAECDEMFIRRCSYGEWSSWTKIATEKDIPTLTTETWTFTLEDGSTVTKAVYVG